MARYYRRYRRYRPRRYVRRWFRRRFRRYVNGSSKSSIRMKTAVDFSSTVQIPDKDHLSSVIGVNAFTPTSSTSLSVLSSPLYRTYCSLYEECKCIGMRVSLSISSQIGGTALPSLQIYTAWDRRHGSTESLYTADQIRNSSTYNVATALNNNVAKLTRSIYASDLMEKAQWHDCTLDTASGYADKAYTAAGNNPNFFAPCFFFCFASPSLAGQQSPATVGYSISTVYYFAFRNPKYGGASGATKVISLGAVTADFGEGDIDDPTGAKANLALAAAAIDDEMMDDTRALEPVPAATAAAATVSQTTKTRARKAADTRADPRLSARPPPN